MSAEKAKENANPLSPFKGLGAALRSVTGMKFADEAISCGAKAREDNKLLSRQKGGMEL